MSEDDSAWWKEQMERTQRVRSQLFAEWMKWWMDTGAVPTMALAKCPFFLLK